ncbi:ABC transporter substrate-binding protein [Catenovulum sp. 2E275]|uniref:ABC transporter substrate-binding protein n=1 Tax=Catenovulum sp. 2E275 TaxID=2980497 RepID=UPI0021D01F7E|nr:ABC transporter substrate-binding protein [Catenovulum sp. 2E275]MCU4676064.1 ABC transporter substrate-binding protein [Catenovulum sp. 2E275]
MKLKTLSKWVAAAALVVTSASSFALEKVVYQLDWLPGGDKAPVYVGKAKGFFKDVGIDVDIAQGRGSTDAITKMAAGHSDIGSADIVALLAGKANNNVPVTGVMNLFSQAPYAFFSLEKTNINSVKDLIGKQVASSPFTSSNVFFPYMMKANGVEESQVEHIKANPGSLAPMMLNGRTDAITSWVTDTTTILNQAEKIGVKVNIMPWHTVGLNIYSSSIVASDKFLKERPEVAKKFIKALKKSIEYTWANPDEAGAIVHQLVPEVDGDVAAGTIKSIKELVFNPISEKTGLGVFDKDRLAETWRLTAIAQELPQDKLDPETAIDRSFLGE